MSVVLSYFDTAEGDRLLADLRTGVLPRGVPVHVGSYGIAPAFAAEVAKLPDARYAPIFPVHPSGLWTRRSLPPEDAKRLPRSSAPWAGTIPAPARLLALPAPVRVTWGTELGRRFRDALRTERRNGTRIPSWQVDEVISQVAVSQAWRQFVRGVLDGVALGRPPLADPPEQGVVWIANHALPVFRGPLDRDLRLLRTSLERAGGVLAAEEFPDFTGDPRASARAHDAARAALGPRYAAGIAPGLDLRPGLGGNVGGLSPGAVAQWRATYLNERAALGVRSFAVFDFRRANGTAAVIGAVLREVAAALRLAGTV